MTQYPGFTPGGVPPNQIPPYGSPYMQPPQRTSAAAITSLIFGVVFCVPFVSGLVAIICGIVGLGATRKPGVTGRGMAIAGLILGILGLLGWTGFGGVFGWMYVQTKPDRAVASAFVSNLASGNLPAAQAQCGPQVSPLLLDQASKQLQAIKPLTSYMPTTSIIGFDKSNVVISGVATFGNITKTIIIMLQHKPDGSPFVVSWQIQ